MKNPPDDETAAAQHDEYWADDTELGHWMHGWTA